MIVEIEVSTGSNQFTLKGSANGNVFIGGVPVTLNLAGSSSGDDIINDDLIGASANRLLMHQIVQTVALSPTMMISELPQVRFKYKSDNRSWGEFYCDLFKVNSLLRGSANHGAALSDIRNYVIYNNLKSSTHMRGNLGGAITEDFFLYKDDVISDDDSLERTKITHIQRSPKTIKQVFPKEENKQLFAKKSIFYGATVNKCLKEHGVGDIGVQQSTENGVPYNEMVVTVSEKYCKSHDLDVGDVPENGVQVPINQMDLLFYEITSLCADIISYKSHFPVILLNCADYETVLPSQYIPLLRAFNSFIKRIGRGIVLYFNVNPMANKFYDSVMSVASDS